MLPMPTRSTPRVLTAYLGQLLGVAEGFLRDCDGATFGVSLSKEGISTGLVAEFSPGSYAGKAFAAMKNSDASFTAGLPDGKYFVYGGMTIDKAAVQMLSDFIAPIEKEVAALGSRGQADQDLHRCDEGLSRATTSSRFGLVAPPAAAIGQEGLLQMVNVVNGDPAKLTFAQKQMLSVQNEFMALTAPAAWASRPTSRSAPAPSTASRSTSSRPR